MSMNTLLCIVGQTGTGKTAKAIEISALTPNILVSADSRQVYRDMDIVTGKDHPTKINIAGVDICEPNEPCSVAVWYEAVLPVIEKAWQEEKLVIVVGGTGLYLRALTEGIPTMQVPMNESLRKNLSTLSITELQEKLWELSPEKFSEMNHSDQDNPRRLVRAIEIAMYNPVNLQRTISGHHSTIIGLKYADTANYKSAVKERVISRLKEGAIAETKKLLTLYGKNLPSMSAIGYRSIIAYLEGNYSEEEMIEHWVTDELAYAKRQMTWFTKVPKIKWYYRDITGAEIYASTKD
jgi:tRNA dimethylallyltransferase